MQNHELLYFLLDGVDNVTVVFKDDYGVLVRFISSEEIFIEYYNFL